MLHKSEKKSIYKILYINILLYITLHKSFSARNVELFINTRMKEYKKHEHMKT